MENKMLCPNCGKNPASKCRHLIKYGGYGDPVEYDCNFWWDDTLVGDNTPSCEECPLAWCDECREYALANWYAAMQAAIYMAKTE